MGDFSTVLVVEYYRNIHQLQVASRNTCFFIHVSDPEKMDFS